MLVGCANWAVTLGRFDVHFSVSTMVRYNAETRKVHLGDVPSLFQHCTSPW